MWSFPDTCAHPMQVKQPTSYASRRKRKLETTFAITLQKLAAPEN
jgi:hypothetical protein